MVKKKKDLNERTRSFIHCLSYCGHGTRTRTRYFMNKKGFTLIEIIVLIVMAGIIIPVIIVPFATGIRASTKPEMVNRAMYLAHQRMEELMKYNYRNAALDITGVGVFNPFSTGDPNYPGDYEIVYVTNGDLNAAGQVSPDTRYKRIHIRVTDPDGITYEVYSVVTNFP
jgi:type II secretory pathway pseudopilin PulG